MTCRLDGVLFVKLTSVERIADILDIEIHELFIDPLSSHEELERLYQTVAKDIEKLVVEAIKEALTINYIGIPPK